ncbi:hypothetical protein IE81DRAFT_326984 [Ceraceosorus guamensis]|uniref:Lysophospholipase NTE1 n=1 Tax=Ceraceosorus guamensis TaxID=1522189 RepID=A0A316VNU2_9BASI|nr:hypothetical protein IE81DRAFT_326984 [Ceraceosorus guamensis]PWN38990.1 hypothetical protein IE81DRAFT_326984 [Ceraceosorus guamensis]
MSRSSRTLMAAVGLLVCCCCCLGTAYASTPSPHSHTHHTTTTTLNPLAALLDGMRQVLVASLHLTAATVRFASVTLPSAIYSVLHYSLTLQLNFPSLALLFLACLVAAFVWLRYRHLNRYERLREVPLAKDEGFNLHPDVGANDDDDGRGNGFSNYLDEFLQAIRIFGFLEKPVFHELARHLQTRRLIAGDTLSLDSDFSFYIVIDGRVQVYAPTPPARESRRAANGWSEDEDEDEGNGYHLLNEVTNGGTLSSLFTILSLFTEDVKVGFGTGEGEDVNVAGTQRAGGAPGSYASSAHSTGHATDSPRRRTNAHRSHPSDEAAPPLRPSGDQLQLNAAALRNVPSAMSSSVAVERLDGIDALRASPRQRRGKTSSGTDDATVVQGDEDEETSTVHDDVPGGQDLLPPAQASAPFPHFARAQARASVASSFSPPLLADRGRAHSTATNSTFAEASNGPHTPGSILSGFESKGAKPSHYMHHEGVGTVARAVTDTTLAVIPADAFKRLTKKYPNAAAHIVQVILTRLSRVTFHTAHKYLGLTREVMRTEKHINELACFTLPAAFYEQGGMERLRQRFLPEPQKHDAQARMPSGGESATPPGDDPHDEEGDYFRGSAWRRGASESTEKAKTPKRNTVARVDPARTPWGHPDPPLRTPTSRTSVGPGDLLSMTGTEDGAGGGGGGGGGGTVGGRPGSPLSYLVSTSARPRAASRGTAIKGSDATTLDMLSLSSLSDARLASPVGAESAGSDSGSFAGGFGPGALADFNLKDAVMGCIARSIGLMQQQSPGTESPGQSLSASPFINPADTLQRSVFRSAFSSLSMLDAAMAYDEESSVTGASSSALGPHHVELENEVEVRFFPAGSVLASAGDAAAGLFYVIDGFLDVVVPPDDADTQGVQDNKQQGPKPKLPGRAAPLNGQRSGATSASRATAAPSRSGDAGRGAPAQSDRIGNALDGTASGARARARARSAQQQQQYQQQQQQQQQTDHVRLPEDKPKDQRAIFSVGRGGIAGYLSSLLGAPSYVDIRAKTDTYVGVLPAKALGRVMERRPIVLLTLCKRLLSLLSPLILQIDSALEWESVNAGQVIYREGEASDSFYVVINGRLRAITERGGGAGVDSISEYGQGDSVGELDVVTRSVRRKTLHAIRDSELARMPMTLFNAISMRHPTITIQMSRIIARRVREELNSSQRERGGRGALHTAPPVPGLPDLGRNNLNLKTVAIVPVTREVPITNFANRLQAAFEDTIGGPTAFLNQSSVMGVLGRHAFNRMGKLKLAGWLAEQEQRYRLVLYVVDTAVSSPWAQTSIRQADCVLLVGFGDDPSMGEYERLLLGIKTTARKELVLLHPERSVPPGATRAWLKSRPWIHAHHHVELPGITRSAGGSTASGAASDPRAVKALRTLKAKLETSLHRYSGKSRGAIPGRPHHFSDFARLARRLCGKSIGLVLGGGGARGCAHVGFLRALEERGIPIDMVGGTSIGSLVGGLYAKEAEMVTTFGRVKKFAGRMASLWRFASDLTYPVVSYTTGHEFNRGVFKALSDTHIEDMWLPFFCNTTNITWSRMEVHTTGYAWRYIRGSMTLAGLIPPLVDDGHMLVDGGYMDNLPVSVMMAMGAHDVFAVDVGSIDDTSPRSYGDTLSGWWVLLNKWNPWSDARNIPSITDIQGRLTYVSSVKTLDEAKSTPGCFYLRMPVEGFGTMEFGRFNEVQQIGYEASRAALAGWAKEGSLPTGMSLEAEAADNHNRKRGVGARRNSV